MCCMTALQCVVLAAKLSVNAGSSTPRSCLPDRRLTPLRCMAVLRLAAYEARPPRLKISHRV